MSASKPRGKNWTPMEDEALCRAWLEVSQDSIVGTNQRTENLYARIFEKFLEYCTENDVPGNPELRAPSGIKSQWHSINSKLCQQICWLRGANQCSSAEWCFSGRQFEEGVGIVCYNGEDIIHDDELFPDSGECPEVATIPHRKGKYSNRKLQKS